VILIHPRLTATVFALAAAGCSSSTTPNTGTLEVIVNEPTGLVGAVTVAGPNGFNQTIHATQSFSVPEGTYTITAASVVSSDSIVSSAYTSSVTGSPAVVSLATTTAATVNYSARTGSGGLWVSGGSPAGAYTSNTTVEYPASLLHASSQLAPTVKLGFGLSGGTAIDDADLAFDPAGNLWIVDFLDGTLVEYPISSLAMSGTPMPSVTIQLRVSYPTGLAFDVNGNLWVVGSYSSNIVEFTPSQLAASGSPAPAVTITESPLGQEPIEIAFDARGDLWVANNSQNAIVEYAPDQLARSGNPAPTVTISGPSLEHPVGIAFDKAGNLWVANEGANFSAPTGTIVGYAAARLRTTGTPAPMLTLTPPTGQSGPVPVSLAFDDSGDLWYADLFNNWVARYSAAALMSGGSPLPSVTITSSAGVAPEGLAFNPHPSTVPLP
jgi:streptogramin lyase